MVVSFLYICNTGRLWLIMDDHGRDGILSLSSNCGSFRGHIDDTLNSVPYSANLVGYMLDFVSCMLDSVLLRRAISHSSFAWYKG